MRSRSRSGSARVGRERELLEHNFLRLQEVQERLRQQLVQTEDAFLNGSFKTDDQVAGGWIQNFYVHESALRVDPYNTPIPPRLAYAEKRLGSHNSLSLPLVQSGLDFESARALLFTSEYLVARKDPFHDFSGA